MSLAIVVFAQVRYFQLLEWDDRVNIRDNPYLTPLSGPNLARFWKQSYAGLYIPLAYTTLSLEAAMAHRPAADGSLTRYDPGIFHLGNLLLHLANIALVFVFLKALVGCAGAAAIGAALFAIHPLQVESVAWATEIKGLLATLFSLIALWQYQLAADHRSGGPKRANGRPDSVARRRVHYALASAALVLALLSKPSAAAVPLVALMLDLLMFGGTWRGAALRLGPWLVVAALFLVLTKRLQPSETMAAYRPPLWLRPLVALDALAFYFWKLAWPWPLGPDYGRGPDKVIERGWVYWTWIGPAAVFATAAALRAPRIVWAALGIFIAALLPVLGLVPFGYQEHSTVADRYVYLGMLGISLAAAWWMAGHWNRKWQVPACLVLFVLSALAHRQTGYWRDDYMLFAHCLKRINADSYVALNNVGVAIERSAQNQPPALRNASLAEAAGYYQRAIRLGPHFDEARQHLGFVLAQLDHLPEAIATFEEFLRLRPNSPTGHANLANLYVRAGQPNRALEHYRRATELAPNYANAWIGMAATLLNQGDLDGAEAAYRRALAINPGAERALRGLELIQAKRAAPR